MFYSNVFMLELRRTEPYLDKDEAEHVSNNQIPQHISEVIFPLNDTSFDSLPQNPFALHNSSIEAWERNISSKKIRLKDSKAQPRYFWFLPNIQIPHML